MAPAWGLVALLGAASLLGASLLRRTEQRPKDDGSIMDDAIELNSLADYRQAAWALANYAVNGAQGRAAHGDSVYTEITLGLQDQAKQQGWFFSSCAFRYRAMLRTMNLALILRNEVPR
jgi:hypothetical protein